MIGLGRRGGWAVLTAGIAGLGVLEAVAVHFIAPWLVVDVVAGVLTAFLVLAFASPLWSRLRVDRDPLRVRFGWLAAIDVPRHLIRDAAIYRPDALHPVTMGIDFDASSEALVLVRSAASPLARLDFTEPLPARIQGWKRVRATSLVLSTDRPDELVARLTEP